MTERAAGAHAGQALSTGGKSIFSVDGETVVSSDNKQGDNAFTGKIVKVTVAQL